MDTKKISRINLHLSYYCNCKCDYCFLTEEARERTDKFTKYDELLKYLESAPLDKNLVIYFVCGELSFFYDELVKAYKQIKKLERSRDVKIKFGIYTNGSKMGNILDLLDRGILSPEYTNLSWDGIYSASTTRQCKDPYYDDSIFNSNIKLLGESKYKDSVLIRSALTLKSIHYFEESVKYMIECGCTKWEYYLLIDCEDYRDKKFLDIFKYTLERLYGYTDKINIYNISSMEDIVRKNTGNFTDKKVWCGDKETSLDIDINGDILLCGSFSDTCRYSHNDSKLWNINEPFDEKVLYGMHSRCSDCHKCDYTHCENMHCSECARLVQYREQGDFSYKASQPCKVRDIERILYRKW